MLWFREQRFALTSTFRERVREGRRRYQERRAERKHWAQAETLRGLGDVTARWLEGEFKYHPGGYDEGPAGETTDLIPALAALNRSGFVTSGSQPGEAPTWGFDGRVWQQRAAVDGFTDTATADRLEAACQDAGLVCIRNGQAGWRTHWKHSVPVTASPVDGLRVSDDDPYYVHTHFGTHLSRKQVNFTFDGYGYEALRDAEQVTIIDPEWGRNDRLWSTLTGHTPPIKETRYSGVLWVEGAEPQIFSGYSFNDMDSLYAIAKDNDYQVEITAWNTVIPIDSEAFSGPVQYDEYDDPIFEVNDGEPPAGWCNEYFTDPAEPDTSQPYFLVLINRIDAVTGGKRTRLRESGFGGWIDQDGYAVACPSCGQADCTKSLTEHWQENNNGGSKMTAPTSTSPASAGGGDIQTIADLRREYERSMQKWAQVSEQHTSVAAELRNEAMAFEQAVGGMASEHDAQTKAEASQALEAVLAAVAKHEEAAAVAADTHGALSTAHQGLERHRNMEEAVASHPGVAKSTDAYQPQ